MIGRCCALAGRTDSTGNRYGIYSGTVVGRNGDSYEVSIEYNERGIFTNYPSRGCGNRNAIVPIFPLAQGRLRWTEIIEYDRNSQCVDGGGVTLMQLGVDEWEYEYVNRRQFVVGTIRYACDVPCPF